MQLSVAHVALPAGYEPNIRTIIGINLRTNAREQARQHYGVPLLQKLSDNSW